MREMFKLPRLSSAAILLLLMFVMAAFGGDFFTREWRNYQLQRVLGMEDKRGFEQAQVKRVIDGDTIELTDGRKVRYIGIDTPETKDPSQPVGCYGQEASIFNQGLVEGQVVALEKDVSETDRYGRLLRYVWLNNQLINKVLVAEGYAFARSYPPDIAKQDELRQAEAQAREKSTGLWSACNLPERTELNQYLDQAEAQVMAASPSAVPANGCVIKGNISDNGKLYHLPDCPSYAMAQINQEKGEAWFCSEDQATQAGWVKANNCP